MGTGMARLVAWLLTLGGMALVHHCARGKLHGVNSLFGAKTAQNLLAMKTTIAGCDFDNPSSPFCDWSQPNSDNGQWKRGVGEKPGQSEGPPGGRPERRDFYIYPEAGRSVELESPALEPPTSEVCLEFLYYLYSWHGKPKLAVKVRDSSGNITVLWTPTGRQSYAWLRGAVTLQNPASPPFKVLFAATSGDLDVALDSISVMVGPCSPCVTGCDFDSDQLCGWERAGEGEASWELWAGNGPEGLGPKDDFSRPGGGSYLIVDSVPVGTALLKSPHYQSPGGCLSLNFYYVLHGVSTDTALQVYAAAPGSEVGSPLLTLSGEHGPSWKPAAVNYTGTANVQFIIGGVYRGKPGLAVDSMQISPCEEIFAECDFNSHEDPFCGWIQPAANHANWIWTNGTTPTEETGPPGDYPHGEGYYIFAEAGSLKPGQSMQLSSRTFCADTDTCVEFYYYMYGIVEVETQLRVLVEGPSGPAVPLWTRTGVQRPAWLLGSVTMPYGGPQPSKVILEVVRGNNPYLDVALDNIMVRRGPCAASSGTPAPPVVSSSTTSSHTMPAATESPGGPTVPHPPTVSTTRPSRPTPVTDSTTHHPATVSFTAGRTTPPSPGGPSSTGPVAPTTTATSAAAAHSPMSSTAAISQSSTPGSHASGGPAATSQPKTPPAAISTTSTYSKATTTAGHASPALTGISTGYPHPSTTSSSPPSSTSSDVSQPIRGSTTISGSPTRTSSDLASTPHAPPTGSPPSAVQTTSSSQARPTPTHPTSATSHHSSPVTSPVSQPSPATNTTSPDSHITGPLSPRTTHSTSATSHGGHHVSSATSQAYTSPTRTSSNLASTPHAPPTGSPPSAVQTTSSSQARPTPTSATSHHRSPVTSPVSQPTSTSTANASHVHSSPTSGSPNQPDTVHSTTSLARPTTTSLYVTRHTSPSTTGHGHPGTTHSMPTSASATSSSSSSLFPTGATAPSYSTATVVSHTSPASTPQARPTTPKLTTSHKATASSRPTSATSSAAKPTSSPETSTEGTTTMEVAPLPPPGQGTCIISGDPHYTTFDGLLFHFMGTCTYLLSALCNASSELPTFWVEATNEHRGANTQVSYLKSVTVQVYQTRVVLLKGRRATVDGRRLTLPVSVADGRVLVHLSGTFVVVQTDFGLMVRFDGNQHAEVSAPRPYIGQLCGLCGDFNNQDSDDNLMPNGSSAGTDSNKLGESWQVPNAEDLGCTNTGKPDECDTDLEAEAQTSCGILKDPHGLFAPCHGKVPPEGAFENCLYDLCGTGGDTGSLCFALQSYADRCAQAGVTITWRNHTFCPLTCPPGSSYSPCGPACPATCMEYPAWDRCSGLPCVEGCVCDEGHVLSGDQCVPAGQCGCIDQSGQYHPVGENWMANSNCTQRCSCVGLENITCEEWSCSPVQECRPAEGLLGCQDTGVAACHVAGDPHYYTFDGIVISFMGTCTYTLVAMCKNDPSLPAFSITAKNEERGQPEASYLHFVNVEVSGTTVSLQKARRVLIDGERVRTPVEGRIPGVSITSSGIYTVLETDFGLAVKFDGNQHLEIQLPGTYFGKVCGMCGNFNNQTTDDLLMPDGQLATSDSQFGNSWKAAGDADPGCQPGAQGEPQPSCTQQEMLRVDALCREILAPKFQPCHDILNPMPFLTNCHYDLCEYQGMISVLCDNLQSYVEACRSQGVAIVKWRNATFCPLPCPEHSSYSECASPCPSTCVNLYAPAHCRRPTTCVEGCVCNRGYVLSDDSCVPMQDCGCLDGQRNYQSAGDTWVTVDCHTRCTCLGNGSISCWPFQCPDGSHCALSPAGVRYCQPTRFHHCVISGDPHYRTFDGYVHHLQGWATYVLTSTLDSLPGALERLSVAGRNRRRFPFHRVSFLREVYVSVYDSQVTLMQGRKMAVNGVKISPPYTRDGLQISLKGRSLFLQTDFGFSVTFDGKDSAEIVLPSTYQGHVGGLCGNYDEQRNNEYLMPDGKWTTKLNTFGSSWQVFSPWAAFNRALGPGSPPRLRREEADSAETESGFEVDCSPEQLAAVNGTKACGALSDPQGAFVACHSALPPSTFQESCVYDLCALPNDAQLLCQNYEVYALLCQEEAIPMEAWRSKMHCEMECPPHTTYTHCMSACPASCANMAAQSTCTAPCVEGCASEPGYVFSGLDSVPYDQCGCTSNNHQYYQINDTFLTDDCSQRCTCLDTATLVCEEAKCSEGQQCTVANFTRGCFRDSACLRNPCQNEGTCEETSNGFLCSCSDGYEGVNCEQISLATPPSPSPRPLIPPPPDNTTAILIGVFVPLGLILIVVLVVCICQRRKKKKIKEDRIAVLSAPGQANASDTAISTVTRF